MNDFVPKPQVCPRCRKGTRVYDRQWLHGYPIDADYCGFCGKNWPTAADPRPAGENVLQMPTKE